MRWSVRDSTNADLEAVAAKFPQIRMINFPLVGSQQPIWTHPKTQWEVCTPDSVSSFSAVGYFFGRQLHQTLDVPIGLINNSWGGSACEAWIDRQVLEQAGHYDKMLQQWDAQAQLAEELASRGEGLSEEQQKNLRDLQNRLKGNQRPANIYNGVLKSHLGYSIRGASGIKENPTPPEPTSTDSCFR